MEIQEALCKRDLRGCHVLVSGRFWLTPQRHIKRHLRTLGAVIATEPRRAPRVDALFYGDDANQWWVEEARTKGWALWDEVALNEMLGLMHEPAQHMESLRGLCHDPKVDAGTWRQICAVLEFWPQGESMQEAIDYVQYFVDRWSKEDRRGLPIWYKRARSGTLEPRLTLCCAEN